MSGNALALRVGYTTDQTPPIVVFRATGTVSLQQPFAFATLAFPADAFTASLWLRTTAATGTILDYATTGGSRFTIANPSQLDIALDATHVTPQVSLVDGAWHHLAVAVTRAGRARYALAVYVDAQLIYRAPAPLIATADGIGVAGQMTVATGLAADLSNLELWHGAQGPLDLLTNLRRRPLTTDASLVLGWRLDSLSSEGPNAVDSFVPSAPPLRFRMPVNATGWVVASWLADGTSQYTVQVVSADGSWTFEQTTTAATLAIPNVALGQTYRARVGKVTATGTDWDEPVALTPIDLAPPTIAMTWPAALTAGWAALDQAGAYAVTVAGTTTVGTDTTSTALDAQLDATDTVGMGVRAQLAPVVGTAGPTNDLAPADAPTGVTFVYDPNFAAPTQAFFEVTWAAPTPAADFVHAAAAKTGAATRYPAHAPATATKLTLPLPNAGYQVGDQIGCRLRAVRPATLGQWATQTVTVTDLGAAPVLAPLEIDASTHSVTIRWSFDETRFPPVSYRVEITAGTAAPVVLETTTRSVTWSYASIANGTAVTIQVRALARQNLGRWSNTAQFVVGTTLGRPTVTGVSVNTALTITASWTAVPGAASYHLVLRNPADPSYQRTLDVPGATTTDWPRSATGIAPSTTYTLTVTATAPGVLDGPASAPYQFNTADQTPGTNPTPIGEPINQVTGQYLYAHLDFGVVGVVPIQFITHYVSPLPDDVARPSPIAPHWNHAYNIRLTTANGIATVRWGDDGADHFTIPASLSGDYPKLGAPNGTRLVADSDLNYTLTKRDGSVYSFDASGVLHTIAMRDGNVVRLTYTGALLTEVRDVASDRAITLTYTGTVVDTVSDGSRTVRYARDPATGDLTRVTDPAGKHRDFTYHAGSLLNTATDENGDAFVTNTYWPDQRIHTQQDARGFVMTLTYVDGTGGNGFKTVTTTVERDGYTTRYYADLVTQRIAWEVQGLTRDATGDVLIIGRQFDGLNRLASETRYQGPPPTIPPAAPLRGNTTQYGYDGAGNLTSIILPTGESVTSFYNPDNTLQWSTDLLGDTTRYTYDNGLLHQVDAPLGFRTVFTYQDVGRATRLLHQITQYPGNANDPTPAGNVTTLDYDAHGQLHVATLPLNVRVTLDYDATFGWLTARQVDGAGGTLVRRERYDLEPLTGFRNTAKVQFAGQTEAQAFGATYHYDALGAVTEIADALGHATGYGYTADNLLETITYPPAPGGTSEVTTYRYDANGAVSRLILATTPDVAYGYEADPLGRITGFTDANGRRTGVTWTMTGLADAKPWYPVEQTVTYPKVTGATQSEQFRRAFDPQDRVVALTNVTYADQQATAPTTTYAYAVVAGTPANTFVVTTTLPKATPTAPAYQVVTEYDAHGRPTSVTDQRGKRWVTTYDVLVESGTAYERARSVDPVGNAIVRQIDPFGRVVRRQLFAPGGTTAVAESRFGYDPLGRLTSVTELGDGGTDRTTTFAYAYDATSNSVLVSVSPYGGTAAVYGYDAVGRWRTYADPAGPSVAFDYYPNGRLATYRDARQQTLTYRYDAAGRFTTLVPASGAAGDTIEQALDGNGNRLETRVGGAVAIGRTFDELNRPLTRRDAAAGETVTYTWWPGGTLKELGYPGLTRPVQYVYDGLARLSTVTDWLDQTATYTWWPTGQLETASLPGGLTERVTIDDAGRVTGQETAGADGTLYGRATYVLDAAGRPALLDRILPLAPDRPAASTTTMLYTGDRLDTVNGTAVEYDADNNMRRVPGIVDALEHDERSRLVRLGTDTIAYDPDGLRSTVLVGATALRGTYDAAAYIDFYGNRGDPTRLIQLVDELPASTGEPILLPVIGTPPHVQSAEAAMDRLLALTDGQGALQARYVWGVGLISAIRDTATTVHIFDAVGSTLALVNAATGAASDRYTYDPFGRVAAEDGATPTPFRWHGRWGVTDTRRGLLDMRARDYAPAALRFTQKDPIYGRSATPQSLNRFAFALGNPLQLVDPLGYAPAAQDKVTTNTPWWLFAAAGAAVVTVFGLQYFLGLGVGGTGAAAGGGLLGGGGFGGGGGGGGGGSGALNEIEMETFGSSAAESTPVGGVRTFAQQVFGRVPQFFRSTIPRAPRTGAPHLKLE